MSKRKKENPLFIYLFKKCKGINISDNDEESCTFDQQCLTVSDSETVSKNSISNASSSFEKVSRNSSSIQSNILDVIREQMFLIMT